MLTANPTRFGDFLLSRLEALPECPHSPILGEAMALLENPNTPMERLVETLSRDRQLSGRLVDITSQAARRQVHTIEQAVRLIGVSSLKGFLQGVSAAATTAGLDAGTLAIMQGRLLDHSGRVGICAHLVAFEIGYPRLAEAYTAGLLHDLGRSVLDAFAYEEINQAIKLTQAKAISLTGVEDQTFGINHAYLGAKILQQWGLPEMLQDAVRCHHAPAEATSAPRLARIVHLADVAVNCQEAGLPIGISLFPVDKAALEWLPFPKAHLLDLARSAARLAAKASLA